MKVQPYENHTLRGRRAEVGKLRHCYIGLLVPSDSSNLVAIKVRVAPEILEQAKRVADINGVKLAEQARWFFIEGLAAAQKKLKDEGRWPVDDPCKKPIALALLKIARGEPLTEAEVLVLEEALGLDAGTLAGLIGEG